MTRSFVVSLLLTGVAASPVSSQAADPEPRAGKSRVEVEQPLEVRTFPVADLVVPLPQPAPAPGRAVDLTCAREIAALEQHLRRLTGQDAWGDGSSIQPFPKTLSLVIRQTPGVHARIAEELSRLRRELDVQASLEIRVITGPRQQIAALADAFPGELGHFETQQLMKQAGESKALQTVPSPKVTLFSRQTVHLSLEGRTIAANAVVSADRRSMHLKVSENSADMADLVGNLQVVKIHSGRSVALRFEAPSVGSVIPPAPDAVERLLVITPRVIVQPEEEERVVLTVKPRIRILPEEEFQRIAP